MARISHWSLPVIVPTAIVLMLGGAFAHMRFRVDRAETLARLEKSADQASSPAQKCFAEVDARLLAARNSITFNGPAGLDLQVSENLDPASHCESALFLTQGQQVIRSIPQFAKQKFADLPVASWNAPENAGASVWPVTEGPYENGSQDWYVVVRIPYQGPVNGWLAAAVPISRLFDSAKLKEFRASGVDVRIAGVNETTKASSVYLRYGGSASFSPLVQKRLKIGRNQLLLELSPFPENVTLRSAFIYGLLILVLAVSAGALGFEYYAEVERLKDELQKRNKSLREIKAQLGQATRNRGDLETLSIGAAYQDVMTGLPNWLFFLEHLERSLQRTEGNDNEVLTVVLAELDHLSDLQKRLDSTEMEQLLLQAVKRFEQQLRPSDLAAARLGQGELAFLLYDSNNDRQEGQVSQQLTAVLEEPFVVNEKLVILSTSLGFANSREYPRAQQLVQGAEIKLESEKARLQKGTRGRTRTAAVAINAIDRKELADVKTAIERNELRLEYLPIISLESRRIYGLEVLARWHHTFKGIISPSRFIPLAEASGQAEYLTKWVLNESVRQLAEWRHTVPGVNDIFVSLNLTPHEFARAGLGSAIETVLTEFSLPANRLSLELDEEILSGDVKFAVDLSQRLRAMGIRLSFEEFGAGFAALSSLQLVGWDYVKVARKFGNAMAAGAEQQMQLRALTHMAQDLRIECIAKAIETEQAAGDFVDLQYRFGQGFLFHRPLHPSKVEELLRQQA